MRLRFGVVLCFFATYLGIGCREPLTPNIDRNQAPETWITAAPFDTITIKDENLNPIGRPLPGTIPVRFHVYWAGSDRDGAVAGFYWAVVETLPRPPEGQIAVPNLPGPKPQDYHYTTKTDSFFIFAVAEDIVDRQHAFFIYAVDNQGKPDPTPARFIFIAADRFPPIPIFEECRCIGTVYDLDPLGGVIVRRDTTFVTDVDNRFTTPRDTCASGSTLIFKWHAELTVPQTQVIGFRYKLDESRLIEVGPEVTMVTYNSGIPPDNVPPSTGTKIFTLRAVDQAFGSRDSTRRFQYNYSPDTWLSGPDLTSPALIKPNGPNGVKYVLLARGEPPAVSGSLLSPDSTLVFPALRPERRTFFEVWKDTVFARSEDDTVHMNSWIILHAGGFDRDSRYNVVVTNLARELEGFPGGPVLDPGPPNGSPIGVRSQVTMALTPNNYPSFPSISGMYPIFDPNYFLNAPRIGGYHPMISAGRAFAAIWAVDGDNSQDRRIVDARDLVQRFEAGTATPEEQQLRNKVLTFFVNRAPYLVTDHPLFRPKISAPDTFFSQAWDLRLVGADEDPWIAQTPPGGPSTKVTLRRRVAVRGVDASGLPIFYEDPTVYLDEPNIIFVVPGNLAPGLCALEVELCDCSQCEDFAGTGRCRRFSIPVYYQPTSPQAMTSRDLSRPGSGEVTR